MAPKQPRYSLILSVSQDVFAAVHDRALACEMDPGTYASRALEAAVLDTPIPFSVVAAALEEEETSSRR